MLMHYFMINFLNSHIQLLKPNNQIQSALNLKANLISNFYILIDLIDPNISTYIYLIIIKLNLIRIVMI